MRTFVTLIAILFTLSSCSSVKHIYTEDSISDRQFDKLVKNYIKEPGDTANANKLQYAYQFLLYDHLGEINALKQNSNLQNKERLIAAYDRLEEFYGEAGAHPTVRALLQPGNVAAEKEIALRDAATAWYAYGEKLLAANSWQTGREAHMVFSKVNGWVFDFNDTRQRLSDAFEMGTIDAVIQPLRSEGFYYNSGYTNSWNRFSLQLTNDLASAGNNEMYRVYTAEDGWQNQAQPDWTIEPVITNMRVDPVRYVQTNRTVTKQIEIGKDSLKNPVYKTISAVLHITEASVCAFGEIETRIFDVQNNQRIASRRFSDDYVMRESTASFTGDKNALSNDDWRLVNNRNSLRVDERWMRGKILERIYPGMLSYLRNELR